MKDLVLFGAGGFAREIVYMIDRINEKSPRYNLLGFVVEEKYYHKNEMVSGYPVLGTEEWLIEHKDNVVCTCVVGDKPKERARIQEGLEEKGVKFETLVEPSIRIHESNVIKDGVVILGHQSLSVDVMIGKGVVLNAECMCGHDVSIGDYSCVMPRTVLSGRVTIGNRTLIGGGSYITPKCKIGNDAVVAAGSVVFRSVKDGKTVLGNPAKVIEL